MADLVNMSDQFKGLPMDSLIGGPLTAACDAQIKLANATADFIKIIGFLPPSKEVFEQDRNAVGDTRTATFKFKRPVEMPTPLPAESGKPPPPPVIAEEEVELEVPMLAIVQVPNLSITTVDVIFDMEVKSSFASTEKTEAEAAMAADLTIGWGIFKAKVHIQGKVSSHKENTRSSDNSAKYHVAVHAEDRGMPEGLARVLDILQTSIAPRRIGAPQEVPAKKSGESPTGGGE
jgi:hypothetical protein